MIRDPGPSPAIGGPLTFVSGPRFSLLLLTLPTPPTGLGVQEGQGLVSSVPAAPGHQEAPASLPLCAWLFGLCF